MVSRRRAAIAGLVIFPVLVLVLPLAGCTGSSGTPHAAGNPAGTQRGPASATPAASVCTAAQIKAAIGDFFGDWNHRDAAALGRLFTADGDLDMATKDQDTLASGAWDSAGGGPGTRGMIAAFAERQWRLGEVLSYSGIEAIDLGGGDAAVVARFADGTVQPMEEAKFAYDCQSQAFFHVVIISAKAARQA
ncbi:MAG: hypothetical protein ACRDOH_28915 [Streptosporangiaceae bacterium]